jgi:transcriptional regulator with XRE-family HTH domain
LGIADNLKRYMEVKGWGPADLERATGVSHSSLSEVLTGKTKNPGYEFIQRVVRNSDADPDFLLTGEGNPIRAYPIDGTPLTRAEFRVGMATLVDQVDRRHKELQDFHQEVKTDLEKLAVLLKRAGLKSNPKSGQEADS